MPIIENSTYKAPFLFRNAHLNTIFPTLFRQIKDFQYTRERIFTPDDDFMDLDWSKVGSKKLLLAVHGLEGSSESTYIKGVLKAFNQYGWDGVAMNFRGCSGEINRQLVGYNMGSSDELELVIQHLQSLNQYDEIVLIGFSLGGNVILKYLGERGEAVPQIISKAIAFSVPCHIPTANVEIAHWRNRIYLMRFLRSLNAKFKIKHKQFPDQVQLPERMPRSFMEFDGQFTAPIHGYKSAQDYWVRCSSKQFMPNIKRPTLLVNAKDDTFLSKECYPYELAKNHSFFNLEVPDHGGHVGFMSFEQKGLIWSEIRALQFIGMF